MTLAAIIPGAVTLPLAGLAMVAVAAHVVLTERISQDVIRRRIRLANGWMMLVAIPLIAAGFSFINPNARPRMFLIVWLTIIAMVSMSILLALADVAHTAVLARRSMRALRAAQAGLRAHTESIARTESTDEG